MRFPRIALLVVLFAAFSAPYAIANRVYQRLPRLEDELAEWYQAQVFASGRLYAASPAEPQAFGVPFVIDLAGRRFSKYPPGHSLLLALGLHVGDVWIVGPWLGALAIAVVYRLGRELFDPRTGLLAAFLGVTSPFYLMLSASLMPHSASLLSAALFGWGVWRLQIADCGLQIATASPKRALAVVTGAALGFTFLVRPFTAICLSVPFAIATVCRFWNNLHSPLTNYRSLVSNLQLLISFLPLAALLPLYNYALTGQLRLSLYELWWPWDRLGFGPDIGPSGYTLLNGLVKTSKELLGLAHDLHGVVYLSLVFIMLALVLTPRTRRETYLAAFPIALILGHGFYFHGSRLYGPRYYYEALPALLLLSARGIQKLASHTAQRMPLLRHWSATALVSLFLAFDLFLFLPFRLRLLAELYNSALNWNAVRAVREAGLHNAVVFLFADDWPESAAGLMQNDLALENDVIFTRYPGPAAYTRARDAHPDRAAYFWRDGRLSPATDPPPAWYPAYPTVRPPLLDWESNG